MSLIIFLFQTNLDPGVLKTFLYAVKNHYWYQMYLDDLPIWGIVGEIDEKGEDFYIWTHKKFEIGWNGDQIVDVNLTSEGRTKLHLSTEKLEFTYEVGPTLKSTFCFRSNVIFKVVWKKSDIQFEDRFDKYLDPNFFQHRIHWFSIFNSFMMVRQKSV